ncbi:MAG: rRNA pseudouridine synthase [Ruminococcaceae bacterium]|nr:rRNA pseudouridine synthase [Oscillospiraceae bacterium]
MRLDKFLVATGCCTRSVAKKQVRAGAVLVNGQAVRSSDQNIDENADTVTYCGAKVVYRKYTYIMLNKPEGYVSATEDTRDPTVLELIPAEARARGMFPCGRLDKNTLGLMLLTDNGELAHKLLAPKSHVSKTYRFKSKFPIDEADAKRFENGLVLEDGYETKPAKIELDSTAMGGYITLVEGKYHQIKRMLEALDNKITYLERVSFGPLTLDGELARGEWRYLSESEIEALEAH